MHGKAKKNARLSKHFKPVNKIYTLLCVVFAAASGSPVFAQLSVSCPADMTFNLTPGQCSKVVDFEILVEADTFLITKTDETTLDAGDYFPVGTTELSYSITDFNETIDCAFSVQVIEFQPTNATLSCVTGVNVSVNAACGLSDNPDFFLNGNNYHCYEDYIVNITTQFGFPVGEDLSSRIGQTLFHTVTDTETGNSCTGSMTIFDNTAPLIVCPDTLVLPCTATPTDYLPTVIESPTIFDNCGGFTSAYFDQTTDFSCNDTQFNGQYTRRIRRTWSAADSHGNNAAPCTQIIFLRRAALSEVVFPASFNNIENPALECGTDFDTDFAATGVPTVGGMPIYPSNASCDLTASFSESQIPTCGGGYTILRNWTVLDDCTNQIATQLQAIAVRDKTAPIISVAQTFSVSAGNANCTASFTPPFPTVTDGCSTFTVQLFSSAGTVSGFSVQNLPYGTHTLTWRALDACNNQATAQVTVTVFDGQGPTTICSPQKTVALGNAGGASLPATIFNNGSYDNCGGNLNYKVRRLTDVCGNETEFAPTVGFCCEDVGNPVAVQIKVTDIAGNFNVCSATVTVNDNLAPALICPSGMEVECDIIYENMSVFGKIALQQSDRAAIIIDGTNAGIDGLATDNCTVQVIENESLIDINFCGTGTIVRSFTATDAAGHFSNCQQTITFLNSNPFYINAANPNDPNDDVIWPAAVTLTGCEAGTAPADTGLPQLVDESCSNIGITHTDQIFNGGAGSYVIQRKWTIVDFCQFGGGGGTWNYTQMITVNNADFLPPQFVDAPGVIKLCVDANDCNTAALLNSVTAEDACTPTANLQWYYEIDYDNDGTFDVSGNSAVIDLTVPAGYHLLQRTVTDASGNTGFLTQYIAVNDCTAPVSDCPFALDTLTAFLDAEGDFIFFAEEFGGQLDVTDNCGSDFDFQLSVGADAAFYNSETAADFIYFNCAALDSIAEVTLWIADASDNRSSCTTHFRFQDNNHACGDASPILLNISGDIRTETDAPIWNVDIDINSPEIVDLPEAGSYIVAGLAVNGDYSVSPSKNNSFLNGVTTNDIVLIRKHILQSVPLSSPYKIIAADVNGSGSVTTADIVLLRQHILDPFMTFTQNTSWRFVDADYVFPDPEQPFLEVFPEIWSENNVVSDKTVNFIGVKIGDVNNTVNPED